MGLLSALFGGGATGLHTPSTSRRDQETYLEAQREEEASWQRAIIRRGMMRLTISCAKGGSDELTHSWRRYTDDGQMHDKHAIATYYLCKCHQAPMVIVKCETWLAPARNGGLPQKREQFQ